MARVKRGMAAHAKHRKVLTLAKGFRGRSSTCFRPALERLEKAWQYAYRDRKNKKREMRALWIQRINAAVRELGLKYSTFVDYLKKAKVSIDRKILAKLAVENPEVFKSLVKKIQSGEISKPSSTNSSKATKSQASAEKSNSETKKISTTNSSKKTATDSVKKTAAASGQKSTTEKKPAAKKSSPKPAKA